MVVIFAIYTPGITLGAVIEAVFPSSFAAKTFAPAVLKISILRSVFAEEMLSVSPEFTGLG